MRALVTSTLLALACSNTACTVVADDPTMGSGASPDLSTSVDAAAGPRRGTVLLFGDSVARLVGDDLTAILEEEPTVRLIIDAADCRRLDRGFVGPCGSVPSGVEVPSGLDGLRSALDEAVTPPATVVVIIGNNAALDRDDMDGAMSAMDRVGRVWWVLTNVEGRGWRDPNNAIMRAIADSNSNAGVIDWFAASRDRDWLVDHVHPTTEGQAALAGLIADHLACDCVPT